MTGQTRRDLPTPRSGDAHFTPRMLLDSVAVGEPDIDPTGRWVVYSRRTIERGTYRSRIWRVAAEGGDPVLLAAAPPVARRPRVSPDGSRVLFLGGAKGTTQAYTVAIEGGVASPIAHLAGGVRAAEWCRDGRIVLIAPNGRERFLAGEPARQVARVIRDRAWHADGVGVRDQFDSLWLVSPGGDIRRLTSPDYTVTRAIPGPDGVVAFLADIGRDPRAYESSQLHAVDLDSGAVTVGLARLEGHVVAAGWSPGGLLAVVGNDRGGAPGWRQPGLYLWSDGAARQLGAELDRPVGNLGDGDIAPLDDVHPNPVWLDDDRLVALVTDAGCSYPTAFSLAGGAERLADGEIMCATIAARAGVIVVPATRREQAMEICRVEGGRLHPLTTHGSSWLSSVGRLPERVSIPHPLGHRIEAWLLRGRGVTGPGPLVLEIHGGQPAFGHSYFPLAVHMALADAGISVIWSDPRGSQGYGQAFVPDDASAWEPHADDLLRVVDWAIEEGVADPARVGVTGLSGGGYMTHYLLAFHPGRFAAGVSESPVTDMVSTILTCDYRLHPDLRVPDDWEAMLCISPYRLMHRNRAPLLLIHMDDDLRCPPAQSEMVFNLLLEVGTEVEMVRYPGECHAMFTSGRPDRRVDRLERIVGWFTRHLGVGDGPEAGAPCA